MNTNNKWFIRSNLVNEHEKPLGAVCPRCEEKFYFQVSFENELTFCLTCGIQIAEWNMLQYLYLIDVEKAPKIVKVLIEYTQSISAHEAENELFEMLEFLGVNLEI